MLLSQEAVAPIRSAKTLIFQGTIQAQVIVILVDSGSSNSFLNTSLAPRLLGISAVAKPINVSVANGQVIQCQSEIN
jgi:predicted aspartyl protease